ncbi:MAG: ADP-ribosylglycohydrolase family protein [Spirochaetia bacterium]|jgi:ADP-ribosylglycohydrolase|nr:ADP-ribosylglycohydrolase family protein [Spirochaetia bacterium]
MNKDKLYGALWGAFCADAYALGPHWEYNTKNIEDADLNWEGYNNPITTYHGKKQAGDFTHYGDQGLWLLRQVAEKSSFDLSAFGRIWLDKMQTYEGYIDHSTKETLENLKKGADWTSCGSGSTDFSAIGRGVPLLLILNNNPEEIKKAFMSQAALTHNSKSVVEASSFFAELAIALLEGKELRSSLSSIGSGYSKTIQDWISQGIKSSTKKKTSLVIKSFGQACDINHGFPGVIHLITKYTDNYRLAMEENVKSGGESAARGMTVGMLLGIINGKKSIPENWIKNLNAYNEIEGLISKF